MKHILYYVLQAFLRWLVAGKVVGFWTQNPLTLISSLHEDLLYHTRCRPGSKKAVSITNDGVVFPSLYREDMVWVRGSWGWLVGWNSLILKKRKLTQWVRTNNAILTFSVFARWHLLIMQHCFFLLGPPNLGLSLQNLQFPQSSLLHPSQSPHSLRFCPVWKEESNWHSYKLRYTFVIHVFCERFVYHLPSAPVVMK